MYIKVNEIEIFYEVRGNGNPLLLIHGNGEDHNIFNKLVDKLSNDYTCYLIDTRGHGNSGLVAEYNYQDMANDIVEFIKVLNLTNVSLYGFSDGGIIGLMIASRYPDLLSRLIVSGVNINPQGIKLKVIILFKIYYLFTRNKKIKLMLTQPNILISDLNKIKTQTLVLAGSNDVIKTKHTKLIADEIKGSKLKILANETHSSYVVNSDKLYDIINNDVK